MSCSEAVKVYTGLSSAASEDGESRELALWLVLRHVDKQGAGWVSLPELRGFCAETGHASERTLRRVLARGKDKYWTVNRWAQRVEYRSLWRVALRLRTPPGVSLPIPLEKLRGRGVRAVGLAGFLAKRDGRPTKVATVERVTGLNARAQQRCRKHLGIERVKNVGCLGEYVRGSWVVGEPPPGTYSKPVWFYRGKVYKWLACSWKVTTEAVRDSHAKRVGKAVRGAVGMKGDGERERRLYYDSLEEARKARNRGPLAWVRRERQYGGAVVWDVN